MLAHSDISLSETHILSHYLPCSRSPTHTPYSFISPFMFRNLLFVLELTHYFIIIVNSSQRIPPRFFPVSFSPFFSFAFSLVCHIYVFCFPSVFSPLFRSIESGFIEMQSRPFIVFFPVIFFFSRFYKNVHLLRLSFVINCSFLSISVYFIFFLLFLFWLLFPF